MQNNTWQSEIRLLLLLLLLLLCLVPGKADLLHPVRERPNHALLRLTG